MRETQETLRVCVCWSGMENECSCVLCRGDADGQYKECSCGGNSCGGGGGGGGEREANALIASRRASTIGGHLVGVDEGEMMTEAMLEPVSMPDAQVMPVALSPAGARSLSFDPARMTAYLQGDLTPQYKRLFAFYSTEQGRRLLPRAEMSKEEHRELVYQTLKAIAAAGMDPLGALIENPLAYFAFSDAVVCIDLSLAIKIGVQCSLWGGSVKNLGTVKHHKEYLPATASMDLLGCFAMTELGHGSNVAALQTEAVFDHESDSLVIHTPDERSIKWWIGNAAKDGVIATVFCRLKVPDLQGGGGNVVDYGVHAIVVPLRDPRTHEALPGVEIRDCGYKIGLNGVDNGALRFDHVKVPRTNLLDRYGSLARDGSYSSPLPTPAKRFAATLGELVGGRVGLAYSSVGVLKTALTIAIRWSAVRRQFGPPGEPEIAIIDYQSQQQRLMPLLATCYAFHFARKYLAERYNLMKKGNPSDALISEVHAMSSGLKAHITAFTASAISTCREACGGHGYSALNRFGQLRNDHDIYQTFEGDNTVLLQQLAGELLKGYARKFQGSTFNATFAYLRQMLKDALPQNPLVSHSTDLHHLRDPSFLLKAMRYRSARLIKSVAMRLRKYQAKMSQFDAWNKCQSHLLSAANAHIESVITQKFLAGIKMCEDPSCRVALRKMFELYALERIWEDIGSWRNEDYVAPNKAKAIRKLVSQLYAEVRQIALPMVDSFDIPDEILRAPIGQSTEDSLYAQYLNAIGF